MNFINYHAKSAKSICKSGTLVDFLFLLRNKNLPCVLMRMEQKTFRKMAFVVHRMQTASRTSRKKREKRCLSHCDFPGDRRARGFRLLPFFFVCFCSEPPPEVSVPRPRVFLAGGKAAHVKASEAARQGLALIKPMLPAQ